MKFSDRMHKVLEAAKKLAAKRRSREQKQQARPRREPEMVAPADAEQLLQGEQEQVASIIDDALKLLIAGPSEAPKAGLKQRMEKLSPAARITVRVLTKLRLEGRYRKSRSR